jgi:hypothetical protein
VGLVEQVGPALPVLLELPKQGGAAIADHADIVREVDRAHITKEAIHHRDDPDTLLAEPSDGCGQPRRGAHHGKVQSALLPVDGVRSAQVGPQFHQCPVNAFGPLMVSRHRRGGESQSDPPE